MDFNVIGEVAIAPTERRTDMWIDALANYSPAVSRTERGHSEIVITLPAATLEQAVTTGLAVLVRAAGQLSAFTVMTTAEFDRRADDVAVPDLISVQDAAQLIGISRQRVQQLIEAGDLPASRVGAAYALPRQAVEDFAQPHLAPAAGNAAAELTERESSLLNAIRVSTRDGGSPPSLRQLAELTGMRFASITQLLQSLERKGYLRHVAPDREPVAAGRGKRPARR